MIPSPSAAIEGAPELPWRAIPTPRPPLRGLAPYASVRPSGEDELALDANEGPPVEADLLLALRALSAEGLRRYPVRGDLEAVWARTLGLNREEVLATHGGDDAIARVLGAFLGPGDRCVLSEPTFSMIEKLALAQGAELAKVPWMHGAFPLQRTLEAADAKTKVIAVVSPNNPTGLVASIDDVRTLAEARPEAVILYDLAYVEFGGEDGTKLFREFPNIAVIRSCSKARGLAGARVGAAIGHKDLLRILDAVGCPYPIATPSLLLAVASLERDAEGLIHRVQRIADERAALIGILRALGAEPLPSSANFVLVRVKAASFVAAALQAQGVRVRAFPSDPVLREHLRITLPGADRAFVRLIRALELALAPEALLFDMDGVLVDVSSSYRQAIQGTAASYGVEVSADDIGAQKRLGGANDDWELTRRLIAAQGLDVPLAEVTARFERLYQGQGLNDGGLKANERALIDRELLRALGTSRRTAVVTGRPKRDALEFLQRESLQASFDALVAREDAPLKPSPEPVRRALEQLGVQRAWMIGDTPDDMVAAARAGALPIGILAPGEDRTRGQAALHAAGAAVVVTHLGELLEWLP